MTCSQLARREFLFWLAMLSVSINSKGANPEVQNNKYGLIGKMIAVSGKRDELAKIMLDSVAELPGCISYVVANDLDDENALWITEVWESRDMHKASLQLEIVQQAIQKGRPLIAGFGERFETQPLGGTGLR